MLHREIIAGRSQIHTRHINTLCGQNVEFVNITRKSDGTNSEHCTAHIVTTTVHIVTTVRYI